MANYPTKYESYQTNDIRGVGFVKYNYVANARKLKNSITPTIIPRKVTFSKTDADVRIDELTDKKRNKSGISLYYHMRGITNVELL